MEYQLVIQLKGDSIEDLNSAIELEDELLEALEDIGDVDGHDVGSGEINIFIFTSDFKNAFDLAKSVLERARHLDGATAAYREADGEDYTVIWPPGSKQKFNVV